MLKTKKHYKIGDDMGYQLAMKLLDEFMADREVLKKKDSGVLLARKDLARLDKIAASHKAARAAIGKLNKDLSRMAVEIRRESRTRKKK